MAAPTGVTWRSSRAFVDVRECETDENLSSLGTNKFESVGLVVGKIKKVKSLSKYTLTD
jgi:hypothetical protein